MTEVLILIFDLVGTIAFAISGALVGVGKRMDLFGTINQAGQTVLMVTHSTAAASRAGRVLFIRDGLVYHQLYREGRSSGDMYRLITDTLTRLTAGGERRA